MTTLIDGFLAVVVAVILNLVVVYLIRARVEPTESAFLVGVFGWSTLIRYCLAIALNIFGTSSIVAATFWGDSGTYDVGGYMLASRWSGESITSVYMTTSVSGYG